MWPLFQNEPGKHCIQRVPPTERSGRKHTSIVTVAVLPLKAKTDYKTIPDGEISVKTQGGSGPGGQHQNKTESAVKMTHLPTGIHVYINGRSQHQNRKIAREILTARVHDHFTQKEQHEYNTCRKEQIGSGSRSNKVRTYNLVENRAVDHRTGKKTNDVKRILQKGEFELLFK